ncbi:hypothetical protein [Luteibacter sp.]|uniref:hypothetical protein n=1 Tax=Luteibacter sp. TaxID=1886636 RepID=UPI003F7F76D5
MKDIDFRTNHAAENEWQAQERGDGPYAAIGRAARQGMEPGLPPDFAERVAATAQARARALRQPARLESWLIGVLLAVLVVTGGAAMVFDARFQMTLRELDVPGTNWLLGLAACAALTQAIALLPGSRRQG